MSPRVLLAGLLAVSVAGCGKQPPKPKQPPAPQTATASASVGVEVQVGESPQTAAPAYQPDEPPAKREPLGAEEILRRSDEVRNPQLDYIATVTVTSLKPKAEPKVGLYDVLVKGRELTLIKTLKPSVERGRVLLMRGKDLWAYLPSVSKPLRISLRERLIGEVANGDLARANFAGDYTPTLTGYDSIDGKRHYVLDLAATATDVTYGRVRLWVETETFHPYQAEFYAVSGRLLKQCRYQRYEKLAGRLRPTQLVMTDALIKAQQSILEYAKMKVGELPEKYFTKDYLKRLME